MADPAEAHHEYGIRLETWSELPRADALVMAVAHKEYLAMSPDDLTTKVVLNGTLIDVKSKLSAAPFSQRGITVWRL
jgi:UDP-N-acetyl-D-galactosamine dehydrogenase